LGLLGIQRLGEEGVGVKRGALGDVFERSRVRAERSLM
jgi:hypothetical protein